MKAKVLTPEQMERAVIADSLFEFHRLFNIAVSDAVQHILAGADIQAELKRFRSEVSKLLAEYAGDEPQDEESSHVAKTIRPSR